MKKSTVFDIKAGIMFALPGLLVFFLVVIIPFVYGFYLTFTDWNGVSQVKSFVGIRNYIDSFKDTEFWSSMWLTLRYVLISVLLVNIVAFFLAYLLSNGIKGQNFFRAGFFTPNLIGGVVLGFIWKFIFSNVFTAIGKSLGAEWLSKSMLSAPKTAYFALILVTVWQLAGYTACGAYKRELCLCIGDCGGCNAGLGQGGNNWPALLWKGACTAAASAKRRLYA